MAGNGGLNDVIHFETRGTWIKKKIILKLHMYKGNIVVMQSKYDAYFRWPY